MLSTKTLLVIGSGGFIGAVARVYVIGFANKISTWHTIALGTLSVNLLGSFIIGLFFALSMQLHISPEIKSFIQTGMLGAFTTYSTFALENLIYLQNQQYAHFAINMSLNAFGSVLAAALGFYIIKLLF